MTNGSGKLLNVILLPGNEAEIKTAFRLLGDVRNKIVLADRGYDSNTFRDAIFEAGGVSLIPQRKTAKTKKLYIRDVARIRHVVENYFARVKRFRRVGTRYDRLAESFLSFVYLASIADWLR